MALIASAGMMAFGVFLVLRAGAELIPYALVGSILGGLISIPTLALRYGFAIPVLLMPAIPLWLSSTNVPEAQAGGMMGFFLGFSAFGLLVISFRWRGRMAGATSSR